MKLTKTIYLKQLLEMGLKKSQVTYIVGHADIFKGIPKQQGYPVNYTFNMAVFIFIGCGLMQLGMSFRHINEILFELCDIDFEDEYMKNSEFYSRGIIQISFGNLNPEDMYIVKIEAQKIKKNILDGKVITLTKKKRTADLNVIKKIAGNTQNEGVYMEGNNIFITLRVKPIVDDLMNIFIPDSDIF